MLQWWGCAGLPTWRRAVSKGAARAGEVSWPGARPWLEGSPAVSTRPAQLLVSRVAVGMCCSQGLCLDHLQLAEA